MEATIINLLKALPETAYFQVEDDDDSVIIACIRGSFVCLSFTKLNRLMDYKMSLLRRAEGTAIAVNSQNWEQAKLYLALLSKGIDDKTLLRSLG